MLKWRGGGERQIEERIQEIYKERNLFNNLFYQYILAYN